MNILDETRKLHSAMSELTTAREATLGPSTRQQLSQALRLTADLAQLLADLSPLISLEIEPEGPRDNRRFEAHEQDAFDAQATADIASKSRCLYPLYRRGFTFTAMRRFPSDEAQAAKWLGDRFELCGFAWNALRVAISKNSSQVEHSFATRADALSAIRSWRSLLHLLSASTLVESSTSKLWHDGAWKPMCLDAIASDPAPQRFLVEWALATDGRGRFVGLLTGHWLTAYVYHLIRDHLRRNRISSYELYTRVEFRGPPEVRAVASDFDLIASTRIDDRTTRLMVECKSGRFGEREVRSFHERTLELDLCLRETGARHDWVRWLVLNPYKCDEHAVRLRLHELERKAMAAGLQASATDVLTPGQVRAAMLWALPSVALNLEYDSLAAALPRDRRA